jgi:septal ring factor EnvC (AmiA/AmiB activator)
LSQCKYLLIGALLPGLAWGAPKNLGDTQGALSAARQNAAAHVQAAARAKQKRMKDQAVYDALAAQQVQAAAALRELESQTAHAAAALANLQNQASAAATILRQNEAALALLLPVIRRLAAQPAAAMLANPETPVDSVRGLLLVQGIAAQIEASAQAVRRETQALASLRQQLQTQQASLAAQSAVQEKAEAALTLQIASANAATQADTDIVASEAAAAASANKKIHDLQGIVAKLQAGGTPVAKSARLAPGGAPVAGAVIQAFGAPTVAGPASGVVYRAAAGARVAAPCAGPVLFANHFQSYGMLVILDCGGGYNAVLSGMARLDVAAGQTVLHGQPVGQMPGYDPKYPAAAPDLYVELRRNGVAVNPAAWLANGGSG